MVAYPDFREKLGILTPNFTTPYIVTMIDIEESGPLVVEIPCMMKIRDRWSSPNRAALVGAILASHTLLGLPIVKKAGLMGREGVQLTIGANVLTDVLAIFEGVHLWISQL